MLQSIIPKLPMRDKGATKDYYCNKLGFEIIGNEDFDGYLMVKKGNIEIHFFQHNTLDVSNNYGQVYLRAEGIETEYESLLRNGVEIHPNGSLQYKPWGMKEFALLDPDYNLLTFGETI